MIEFLIYLLVLLIGFSAAFYLITLLPIPPAITNYALIGLCALFLVVLVGTVAGFFEVPPVWSMKK